MTNLKNLKQEIWFIMSKFVKFVKTYCLQLSRQMIMNCPRIYVNCLDGFIFKVFINTFIFFVYFIYSDYCRWVYNDGFVLLSIQTIFIRKYGLICLYSSNLFRNILYNCLDTFSWIVQSLILAQLFSCSILFMLSDIHI